MTLEELNQQQDLLYRWEYIQHGVVSFGITDEDFDPAETVTDIRYPHITLIIHPSFLNLLIRPEIPWFLACNKERYPYWFGTPDPRNQVLWAALNKRDIPLSDHQREKLFPYIPTNIPAELKRKLTRLFFTPADQNGNIVLPKK